MFSANRSGPRRAHPRSMTAVGSASLPPWASNGDAVGAGPLAGRSGSRRLVVDTAWASGQDAGCDRVDRRSGSIRVPLVAKRGVSRRHSGSDRGGASIVKVGVGGRDVHHQMMTGVGARSSRRFSDVPRRQGSRRPCGADGGVRHPAGRGACAGRRCLNVMIGSCSPGAPQSPGDPDATARTAPTRRATAWLPKRAVAARTAGRQPVRQGPRHSSRRGSPRPTWHWIQPGRCRGSSRPHHLRCRSTCTYVGATTIAELFSSSPPGSSRRRASPRAIPLLTGW